jgi:hypothetical protein
MGIEFTRREQPEVSAQDVKTAATGVWSDYIKPLVKFALIVCAVLLVVGIIVSAASAFIATFGMVAFILLLILLFK